jgi:hypothetical protein
MVSILGSSIAMMQWEETLRQLILFIFNI